MGAGEASLDAYRAHWGRLDARGRVLALPGDPPDGAWIGLWSLTPP